MLSKTDGCKKVFLIHGHNEAKWRELQSVLSNMGVEPVELSEQTINGATIIEKFEQVASQCDFAFALFTYDDIVSANGEEYLQVRPNVIFELGWFYARLGREKVMIIEEKNNKGNVFSDLAGIYRFPFHDQVRELYLDILEVLKKCGIL
ncbi:MAG: nucleotide-binding protein [Blautia sp.]|nr:nucleotide-binding protein [Blautia sp.]